MPLGRVASISAIGIVRGHDLGVDVRFAHTAGDQLRVLRAEVDDEDEVVTHEDRLTMTGRSSSRSPAHADALGALERSCPRSAATGATITSAFWNSLSVS